METYERETTVRAALETVWRFHSTVDGLVALTPEWVDLRVHEVRGPDGEPDPDVLEAGSTVELSVRPFGRGPHRRWRSQIVERRRDDDDAALFRDRMLDGPFETWRHTHRFEAVRGGTRIRDSVEYRLRERPVGSDSLGGVLDHVATVGLAPAFRYRHRRTRELLEEGDWDGPR